MGLAVLVAGGAAAAFIMMGGKSEPKPALAHNDKPIERPIDKPVVDPGSGAVEPAATPDAHEEIEMDPDSNPTTTHTTGRTGTHTTGTTTTGSRPTGTTVTPGTPTGTTGTRSTGTPTTTGARLTGTTTGTKPMGTPTPTGTTTTAAPGTVSADGCDKVSCVIDNFSRPCCEVFRPRKAGELPYELDKGMITAGISKGKAAVIRCGEQSQAKGIVKIAMQVTGDGAVSSATVAESPDPALGECVATAVRNVSFAKTANGGTFTFPFKF